METDQVRQAYAGIADLYIDLFGSPEKVDPDDLEFIGRHLTGRVLDVGCGPGQISAYLHSRGVDVTGVDMVPEFIEYARATHPEIPFRLGTMDEIDAADGILAWYSLIHRPPRELDEVLAGFRRALNPGGTLVVGFFDGAEIAPFDHRVTTAYFWPIDEFARRLSDAGFTVVDRTQRAPDGDRTKRAHAAIAAA